ncbi:hypothetical protein Tco_0601201 [Tanacetum coccineum]
METQKPLLKDEDGEEVDPKRRYQVNQSFYIFIAEKRIFSYLKVTKLAFLGNPKELLLLIWLAYTDSDYAEQALDRKSTIGGCQFLRCRLISWQCKKQTVVANSKTESE